MRKIPNWVVILFLIFIFPLGLILMWCFTSWKKSTKAAITVIVLICMVWGLCNMKTSDTNTNTDTDTTPSASETLTSDTESTDVLDIDASTDTDTDTETEIETGTDTETDTGTETETATEIVSVGAEQYPQEFTYHFICNEDTKKFHRDTCALGQKILPEHRTEYDITAKTVYDAVIEMGNMGYDRCLICLE